MKDSFYFGTDLGVYLFKGINVTTAGSLVLVCFIVGCMAFLFEYLRYLQTKSKQKELKIRARQIKILCPTESATLLAQTITNPKNPLNITLFDRFLLFGTEVSLWILLQNLGYILMLSIMLYDAWILISAVIGGGLGYFVFGYKFMKINMDNCKIIRETYCTDVCGEIDVESYRNAESTPVFTESPSASQNDLDCQQHCSSAIQEVVSVNVHNEPCHSTQSSS